VPQEPEVPSASLPLQQASALLPLTTSSVKKRPLSLLVAASPWLTGGSVSSCSITVVPLVLQSGSV
jgi:hypothetical protein